MKRSYLLFFCILSFLQSRAQDSPVHAVRGIIRDAVSRKPLAGASVSLEGSYRRVMTDRLGRYELPEVDFSVNDPVTFTISADGFTTLSVAVFSTQTQVDILLRETPNLMNEAIESASRVAERVMETPVTVEKVSQGQLRTAPGLELYSSLARFKGIDVARSGLLFSSLSTRGFNSTKSERLIQLVDYCDLMSPSLSIYAGNSLGPAELDLESVDVVYGANSALYGANAFNGVVLLNTKDPFQYTGFSASLRGGSRALLDGQFRYAHRIGSRVAVKLTGGYQEADEFIARNGNAVRPVTESGLPGADPFNNPLGSPLGYNAVNRYGDIGTTLTTPSLVALNGGTALRVYMPGFAEEDMLLTGKDVRNFNLPGRNAYRTGVWKFNPSVHVLLTNRLKFWYEFRQSASNTLYQSSNRYAFRNLRSWVHHLELKSDRWFLRAYRNTDVSSDSYDLGFLGNAMQQLPLASGEVAPGVRFPSYAQNYFTAWGNLFGLARTTGAPAGTPVPGVFVPNPDGGAPTPFRLPAAIAGGQSPEQAQALASQLAATLQLPVGSPEYQRLLGLIAGSTGNLDINGALTPLRTFPGSGAASPLLIKGAGFGTQAYFWDYSGQYNWKLPDWDIVTGGSYRLYTLTSGGTLFQDGDSSPLRPGTVANELNRREEINNYELGVYGQAQKKLFRDRLKVAVAGRLDNFKNFGTRFSPRLSAVWTPDEPRRHNFRVNVSQAFRQPAQIDQFIYLDIGQILLLGNVGNGFNGLVPGSVTTQNPAGTPVRVNALKPERMNSGEIGYKGELADNLFLDASVYHSRYRDFIGTTRFIGREDGQTPVAADFAKSLTDRTRARLIQVWTNSEKAVTTTGLLTGLEWYASKAVNLVANYTYTTISDTKDLILGFNTPPYKVNLGLNGELTSRLSYSANYRYQSAYTFQMPFDEGKIDAFGTLDAQVAYRLKGLGTSVRLGGTNLTNANAVYAYGSAAIGRMVYAGLVFDSADLQRK
ncbi:TonB-dependent receptor plug domain-containing protein [Tellurirhabdus rosea]|uniref:TonB-dependent receptor plug domain-containing protein n=1 Tax=Tellurirhabdus rosea TaxID=2674997 RepID=UPI0022502489|nr:TonB-dependent receptor plug domain-containing protein [Tellurirhabdus rosea]